MIQFLYCLFWILTLRIAWNKRNFFWPIFFSIILTPFFGFFWAAFMDDRSGKEEVLY